MADTVTNDPTADQGPFRLNPPGVAGGLEVPPDTGLAGTRKAIPKLEALEERRQQALRGREQDLEQQSSALSQAYGQRPSMPNLGKVGPAPDARDYQKNSLAFASAMAVLGAIGSTFARIPGTAALSAFGGALKGWQEGNLEAYENAAKQWEQNTKAMIDNNNTLIKQYDMELQNTALNIDQISANIKLKAAQFHDKIAYDNAENIQFIAQYRDKLEQWNNKLESSTEPLLAQRRKEEAEQALLGERVASGQIDPEGIDPQTGQPYTTAQKQTLNYVRQQYLSGFYGTMAKGGGVGKSAIAQDRQQFINEYTAEHGVAPTSAQITAWEAERAGIVSEARKVGTLAGGLDTAVQAVRDTVPAVRELAAKNAGRGYAIWSAAEAKWKVQKGDEGFAEYVFQLNSLVNMYGRVINGGGKATVSDKEHARENLNPNMPYSAFLGAMRALDREVGIEEAAPGKVRARMRGETLPAAAPAPAATPQSMSREDEMALGWARQNPNDPRAGLILQKLGIQ